MNMNLTKYNAEELLLIYKNQSRVAVAQASDMINSYDDYYNYYNYGNYDNYDNYHNYGDYSNYDQYSDSGCFITTAVCKTFGKPDDCRELMSFRHFRDTYMMENEEMKKDIKWYYEVAPKICQAIDAKGEAEAKEIYAKIWDEHLSLAYEALDKKEYQLAYEIYKNMVQSLESIYIKD